jgi:hypothetical protein
MAVRMVKPKVVNPGSLMLERNVYHSGLLHMTLECTYVGIPNFVGASNFVGRCVESANKIEMRSASETVPELGPS